MSDLRTKSEMKKAKRDLEDLFYPPYVDPWDSPCDGCGEKTIHKSDCSKRRENDYAFKGWISYVKKTRVPQGKCDSNGCKKKAVMRIRLNIWGTIGEFDTCLKDGIIKRWALLRLCLNTTKLFYGLPL